MKIGRIRFSRHRALCRSFTRYPTSSLCRRVRDAARAAGPSRKKTLTPNGREGKRMETAEGERLPSARSLQPGSEPQLILREQETPINRIGLNLLLRCHCGCLFDLRGRKSGPDAGHRRRARDARMVLCCALTRSRRCTAIPSALAYRPASKRRSGTDRSRIGEET